LFSGIALRDARFAARKSGQIYINRLRPTSKAGGHWIIDFVKAPAYPRNAKTGSYRTGYIGGTAGFTGLVSSAGMKEL
jgi:hypothetical protein